MNKTTTATGKTRGWQPKSAKALLAAFDINAPDITVSDLALDSRDVSINKAFLAVKGHKLDGREFIPQAISLGAMLIIAECDTPEQHGNINMRDHSVIVHFYQLNDRLSELGEIFYDLPSQKLESIAVTGTNGKTSTTHFIAQLAERCGKRCGLIGTLGAGFLDDLNVTGNTTPNGVTTHRIMAQLVADGAQTLAYEASSHAMVLKRITHVQTKVAVFTNLSRDHLDFHGSMEAYATAKRELLKQPGLSHVVLNMQDIEHENWLHEIKASQATLMPVMFAVEIDGNSQEGTKNQAATLPENVAYCIAQSVRFHEAGLSFCLDTSWGRITVNSALLGAFNVANLAAAVAALLAGGTDIELIRKHINEITPVPGRMELFRKEANEPGSQTSTGTFVVDYAHTPDALEQVLTSVRRHVPGRLWVLFGCGGDRDQGKRPLMGEVASRLADNIILTSDNSRSEDTGKIIQEIQSGFIAGSQNTESSVLVIHDRQEAVRTAVKLAQSGDVVVLAGKGHEDYQIINEQTLPYDERAYVKTLLEEAE